MDPLLGAAQIPKAPFATRVSFWRLLCLLRLRNRTSLPPSDPVRIRAINPPSKSNVKDLLKTLQCLTQILTFRRLVPMMMSPAVFPMLQIRPILPMILQKIILRQFDNLDRMTPRSHHVMAAICPAIILASIASKDLITKTRLACYAGIAGPITTKFILPSKASWSARNLRAKTTFRPLLSMRPGLN